MRSTIQMTFDDQVQVDGKMLPISVTDKMDTGHPGTHAEAMGLFKLAMQHAAMNLAASLLVKLEAEEVRVVAEYKEAKAKAEAEAAVAKAKAEYKEAKAKAEAEAAAAKAKAEAAAAKAKAEAEAAAAKAKAEKAKQQAAQVKPPAETK